MANLYPGNVDAKTMDLFQQAIHSYQHPKTPDNPLTVYLRERQLYLGSNCQSLWEKKNNLQRHIGALDDAYHKQRKAIEDDAKRDGWIVVLTITRDTCIAFLDLAAALIPSKAKKVGNYGSAAIQLAQTGSELYYGQGNGGVQAARTVGNAATIAKTAGKMGPAADYALKKVLNPAKGIAGMNAATSSAQKHTEQSKMIVSTMADSVKGMADLSAPPGAGDTHPAKQAGAIASVIKAVYNYDKATEKAFDDYFGGKIRNQEALAQIERAHYFRKQRWESIFKKAQMALEQCRADNGLF